jgi:phosphomannomutase
MKIRAVFFDMGDTCYYQRSIRPEIPGVLQILRAKGLKLGIISNIQSQEQVPGDLSRYGIRQFFDPIVLSCEFGRRNPDAVLDTMSELPGLLDSYLPELLKAEDIVVGREPRLSSEQIFSALAEGIRDGGADVVDVGACCTPSLYFANADGRFPQHGPNPLEAENLTQIREQVMAEQADLGICFDGDGDRVVFIDETGAYIPGDLITVLLGLHFFRHGCPADVPIPKVLCDVRSSRSVHEYLSALGAQPQSCPVGHALIKSMLRRTRGLYAGELTGHYYFRDFFYCDSALIAVLLMLGIVSREGEKLSELVQPLKRYYCSGELSFTAAQKERIIEKVRRAYRTGRLTEISGLRFDFEDWWFIIRAGSTEPLLRLVVEADTPDNLSRRRAELVDLIVDSGGAK